MRCCGAGAWDTIINHWTISVTKNLLILRGKTFFLSYSYYVNTRLSLTTGQCCRCFHTSEREKAHIAHRFPQRVQLVKRCDSSAVVLKPDDEVLLIFVLIEV